MFPGGERRRVYDLIESFFKTVYNVPELIRWGGLIGLILVVFAETGLMVGFFLPGDSLLVTAGLFAAKGDLNIWTLNISLIIAAIVGDALGYWKEHQDSFRYYGGAILPTVAAHNAFRASVRLLEGQEPVVNTLLVPVPEIRQEDLGKWAAPCMTVETGSTFPVAPEEPLSEEEVRSRLRRHGSSAVRSSARERRPTTGGRGTSPS